jgi:hypothetical protein
MSKSKTQLDLGTPMRPARGCVHPNDIGHLPEQIKAFELEDHNALKNAPRGVESVQDPIPTASAATTAHRMQNQRYV